jgi:hypothetical protein
MTSRPQHEHDRFRLGFALGLIAGEGSCTHHSTQPALSVKLHADDAVTLHFLHSLLGGTVSRTYQGRTCPYRTWTLKGQALLDALPLLWRHLPEGRKRRQLADWLRPHERCLARFPALARHWHHTPNP